MKAVLKKVNGSYLLEVNSYSPVTIEVDGKRVKDFKAGWLPIKPQSVKLVENRRRVVRYGALSVDGYEARLKELTKSRDEEGYFSNIDEEYTFKKFVQDNPAEYEDYEDIQEFELVEYDVTGKTDNPFIIPYRFIGKEGGEDGAVLYQYNAQPYKLAQQIATELGLEEVPNETSWGNSDNTKGKKWSCPSHSRDNLQFTKVNGHYAGYDGLRFYGISAGSYEECLKRYNEHYRVIKEMFQNEIRKFDAEGKGYDKAQVLIKLEQFMNLVDQIDAKRGSKIQPNTVARRIKEFINDL